MYVLHTTISIPLNGAIIQFNILLLIIYLSAIETLIFHTEIEVNKVYFLQFCTKYRTRGSIVFEKYHK